MAEKRWWLRLIGLLAVSAAVMMTAAVAADPGSSKDPLVTLSYLNETFMNKVMQRVDEQIAGRLGDGSGSSGSAESSVFELVTLSNGQTLYGDVGCEAMLRVGTAVCVASSNPGLIDETSGGTLAGGGALAQNHLYMLTISDRGIRATAATVKLLVRGPYTIR